LAFILPKKPVVLKEFNNFLDLYIFDLVFAQAMLDNYEERDEYKDQFNAQFSEALVQLILYLS
jgi:hypothetical protein